MPNEKDVSQKPPSVIMEKCGAVVFEVQVTEREEEPPPEWKKEIGPWNDEPWDLALWIEPETELACFAKRNLSGAWCGYVIIPATLPAYRLETDEHMFLWDCHGGITYTGQLNTEKFNFMAYAVGFDCAHFGDASPKDAFYESLVHASLGGRKPPSGIRSNYKNFSYVVNEAVRLARQIGEYGQLEQLAIAATPEQEPT